jgi:hypothetical protein
LTEINWHPVPLKVAILKILERRQGVILDDELMRIIKREVGAFSDTEFNKALMQLETRGRIHVWRITKTKRRIQLITKEDVFLGVEED